MSPSALEQTLAYQIRIAGLITPETEYRAIPERRFRFDFAWPSRKLLVEVQGGIWKKKGGQSTGQGINRDTEKANLATLAGWRVMAFTPNQIRSGEALRWIQKALEAVA